MDDVDDAVDWVVNLRADATLGGFHLDVDRSLGFSLQNILSDGKQKSSYFVFLRWSYFPIVSKKILESRDLGPNTACRSFPAICAIASRHHPIQLPISISGLQTAAQHNVDRHANAAQPLAARYQGQ
jgi:hypothetical protein